jgi:hypothetical protein
VGIVLSGHWFLPDYGMRWTNTAVYYALTIAGQVWIVRLCVNLRRLAESAERERIAGELHDVLGEALSKITLKAQFAGRLLEQQGDCDRARNEVAAAERICRDALADVRQTIRKYREESRVEQGRPVEVRPEEWPAEVRPAELGPAEGWLAEARPAEQLPEEVQSNVAR